MTIKPVVLFVCLNNAVRSQMAEGILRQLVGEKMEVYSAGVKASIVHPLAVQVMNEAGINITMQRSKCVMEYMGLLEVTHLIILGREAERMCPSSWPGLRTRTVWTIADPEQETETLNQKLQLFRRCRDELQSRIMSWIHSPGVQEDP